MQKETAMYIHHILIFTDMVDEKGNPVPRRTYAESIFIGVASLKEHLAECVYAVLQKEDDIVESNVPADIISMKKEGWAVVGENWVTDEFQITDEQEKKALKELKKERKRVPEFVTRAAMDELKKLVA